jgi:nucleotide-binding universal stress UspA family protein
MALRPGRKDKNFVANADRVCLFYKASLTLLHVVDDDMSDADMALIEASSNALLKKVSSPSNVIVKRAKNPIETISVTSAEYDLLIIGTPEKGNWQNILLGKNKDRFADSSACSVLRLTVKG